MSATARVPRLRQVSTWRRLWQPFWALPAAIMVVSVLLGIVLPEAERAYFAEWSAGFSGDSGGARSVLSTIATAMISVTGLVFSVTMVVLQLASTQFSPRVVGNFLDARVSQVTLGVFTGSFLYSLTVLRVVRGEDQAGGLVPEVSVSISYLYVLASVAMFLAFIQHITSQVQVSQLISDLGHGTVRAIGRWYDDGDSSEEPDRERSRPFAWSAEVRSSGSTLRLDARHGHVVAIDSTTLTRLAAELDVLVVLEVGMGDFLVPEQIIGQVRRADGSTVGLEDDEVRRLVQCLHLRSERELAEDPLFGTRQLVDIAERALSPGINDPTTAAQVVNELHLVLRELATRPDPDPEVRDADERVRFTYAPQTLRHHLDLVVSELMLYGQDNAQVPQALVGMLGELREQARPEHVPTIEAAQHRALSRELA